MTQIWRNIHNRFGLASTATATATSSATATGSLELGTWRTCRAAAVERCLVFGFIGGSAGSLLRCFFLFIYIYIYTLAKGIIILSQSVLRIGRLNLCS